MQPCEVFFYMVLPPGFCTCSYKSDCKMLSDTVHHNVPFQLYLQNMIPTVLGILSATFCGRAWRFYLNDQRGPSTTNTSQHSEWWWNVELHHLKAETVKSQLGDHGKLRHKV